MRPIRIEICCPSAEAAQRAFAAGADRIELCRNLEAGGVTPSQEDICAAVHASGEKAVNVLIRPREGDFVYNAEEVRAILDGIQFCAEAGADGVVIGALTPEREVDREVCRHWIRKARKCGLSVTFHRAIDETADIFRALEDAVCLGVDRVLTSGGKATAFEGRATIAEMVRRAAGRTIVMPGSGVTAENARQIAEETGATEIHGSRISLIQGLR